MKCMNKKAMQNKRRIEAEEERKAEEIRWNSLSPEEQEVELAEREARHKKVMQTLNAMGQISSIIGGPYGKF